MISSIVNANHQNYNNSVIPLKKKKWSKNISLKKKKKKDAEQFICNSLMHANQNSLTGDMQSSRLGKCRVDQAMLIRGFTFWATRKVSLRIPCSNSRDFWCGEEAKMSGWKHLSSSVWDSAQIKAQVRARGWPPPTPTFDWVNSRKLAARPSSSVSLSVFMATFKMWIGSSWTLWIKINTYILKNHFKIIQVNDQPVTSIGLFSSPCCPLHHTGQDYLPLGRLDLGEESRRSSSAHHLCSCEGRKTINRHQSLCFVMLPPNTEGIFPSRRLDPPGELLEGAKSNHCSHALTRWRKRCVEQHVADAGHVHHAVVVEVGWEWHPKASTRKSDEILLTLYTLYTGATQSASENCIFFFKTERG